MTAGYSGRTAAQKLGVVPGSRLGLIRADDDWELDGRPDGVTVRRDLRGPRDVTVVFVRAARDSAATPRSSTGRWPTTARCGSPGRAGPEVTPAT